MEVTVLENGQIQLVTQNTQIIEILKVKEQLANEQKGLAELQIQYAQEKARRQAQIIGLQQVIDAAVAAGVVIEEAA